MSAGATGASAGAADASAIAVPGAGAVAAAATPGGAMSWSMWNQSLVMGAMAGYTPEQWTALQQQNWQQWSHWQEQYAHWQMQYGEKYAEQLTNLNNMQAGGAQPPLPPSNPSEARPPPPPDAPPPQLGKKTNDGHFVPGSQDNQSNKRNQQVYSLGDGADYLKFQNLLYHNTVSANMQMQQLMTAKNQYANDSSQNPGRSQNSYNNKKGKNVATNDYNSQWNEDGTMKIDPQQSMNTWYAHSQAAALQYQTANSTISEEERQFDIQFKKWEEEFQAWKQQNINHPDKAAYQEYEKKFQACRAQLMERKEQMKAKRISALITQKPPALPDNLRNSTNMPYYQSNQNYAAKPSLMGSADKNVHSYDPNVYKGDSSASYSMQDNSSLFNKPSNMRGIPGLDLVDEYARRNASEIVDITADDVPTSSKKPDLKAISKGINNILGDEKLLSMLSIVAQQKNDGTSGKESKRSGSRWVDDVPSASSNHSQTKYTITGAPQQYSYPEETVQSYGETSYNSSQLPSLLDPLPFNTSYYQNAANTSSNDKYSSMDSRHRMDESNMYNAEMYPRGEEYTNNYYGNVDDSTYNADDNQQNDIGPSAKPAWMDYPILEPSAIVDYQHEPIKPVVDFLEPVQTFDYGHMSSDKGNSKDDSKFNSAMDYDKGEGKNNDLPNKGYNDSDKSNDGAHNKSNNLDDRFRDNDRNRRNDRNHARNRDYEKREERSRNRYDDRNRYRDRKDKYDRRSNSNEKTPKKPVDQKCPSPTTNDYPVEKDDQTVPPSDVKDIVMIDDLLESPGREVRPEKIVVILRGLPGSGKSYLAKLIKDREVENGGSAPRILSMDDYFMTEVEASEENQKREMKYEYDASMESVYITSLIKAFKRTISDGFFPFLIVDSVNNEHSHFSEMESVAKQYGFKVYVCEMDIDVPTCHKRNIHDRKLEDIEKISSNWDPTPTTYTTLDATTLLQVAGIDHVQMEDVSDGDIDDPPSEAAQHEEEEVLAPFSSKWDQMDDTDKLARLDGTSKPLRHTASTMEDFLQLDDWDFGKNTQPGKKTVRWADIEERRKQEKMRAIGFVVGQTDWQRMTDPTQGSSALTQTKYIERIPKY